MAEGLANLVEGYVKGQDQKMKRAREVADKAADEWTRQFKVQQAKTDMAQQEITNQQNAARIKLEEKAQADREQAKKDSDALKKRDLDIREAHWKAVNDIAGKKLDVSTQEKMDKAALDLTYKYESSGLGHDEAVARARDTIQAGMSYGQGTGLPQMGQLSQQFPPQQQSSQGNSILSGTGNPLEGMAQPPAQPGVGAQVLPKAAAEAALKQAQTQQALASEQRQKAIAAILTENKDLNQKALQARTALTEANKKKVDREIAHSQKMEPLQMAELTARTIKLGVDAQVEVSNAKVNIIREARHQAESDLKADPNNATAKNHLLDALNRARTSHLHLNEEMMKNVKMSADLDIKINKARQDGDFATMRTATDMKKATDNQLTDLTNSYREQLQEYTAAQKAVKEFGLREVTTPSGGAAKKANTADTRALDRAQRDAERIRPMPIIPPGAPVVPGAQPGLYARPRQSAPAPTSKPGLKKNFKSMSKDELKKYIKAHGG